MALHRTSGSSTYEAVGDEARQGGLARRAVKRDRQVLVRVLAQQRVAAGLDPRVLSAATSRSVTVGPSPRADDKPRVHGPEAFGLRRAAAEGVTSLSLALAGASPGRILEPHGPKGTTVTRRSFLLLTARDTVEQAVHRAAVPPLRDAPRVRVAGSSGKMLPARHPTDAGLLMVGPRQAATTPQFVDGAALG